MAFDTLIKKFFPVIIGLVVALIAHFQAAGVVNLVTSSALAIDPQQMAAGSLKRSRATSVEAHKRTRSAQKIIEHNPFDHATDLAEKPPPVETELIAKKSTLDLSDPLAAPQCEGTTVNIVTESPDPTWSIAVIKAPGEEKPSLRRVGDKAGEFEVAYIGFNRTEASPAVWLVKEASLCQALLFPKEPPPPAASSAPPVNAAASAGPVNEPKKAGGAGSVPKEIADKIEKVSATELNVDRSVVDYVLENQTDMMKMARLVPEKGADGKPVGIRLFGIRPDTMLGTLGLQNGDRIETINGFNMSSPEEALNAYARLRTANKLTVKVTRRGQPTTIDLNIK